MPITARSSQHAAAAALLLAALTTASCANTNGIVTPPPLLARDAACDDLGLFRLQQLHVASSADRAAIEAWQPPEPVAEENRAVIERLARAHIAKCATSEAAQLLQQLLPFATVSSEQPPASGVPFSEMAGFLQQWSEEAGLSMTSHGQNAVWEIAFGEGERHLAFVMHADVVPVAAAGAEGALPEGWSHPPFAVTLDGGRLYGRGSEDDKGAIAAVLTVMRTLSRFGLRPQGELVALLGTGEESDWDGMKGYAEKAPASRYTISVDAEFPLVVGQAGFVAWHLGVPLDTAAGETADIHVSALRGGQFLTQVPGEAVMVVRSSSLSFDDLVARINEAVTKEQKAFADREQPFGFAALPNPDDLSVEVRVTGTAVHSSVAPEGHNALWPLAEVAERLRVADDARGILLHLLARRFSGDHWGDRLQLAYQHEVMGKLLVIPTVLREEDGRMRLSINMRRPLGVSGKRFEAMLADALASIQRDIHPAIVEVEPAYVGEPFLADIEGPLVSSLIELYRRHTGDRVAQPKTIRGGTWARLFPGAVDFGPALPGKPYRGHAPDEYLEVDNLSLMVRMFFDAALELDRTPPQ